MTVRSRSPRGHFQAATTAIMLEVAAELGVAREDALSGTAVDEYLLSSPDAVVSQRDTLQILENCTRLSGDPAFALRFGNRITPAALGALGYVLMSCDDVDQLVRILMRYHRLLAFNLSLDIEPQDEGISVRLEGRVPPRECEVFLAAAIATLGKLLPGKSLNLQLDLAFPEPAYRRVYEELLGSHLRFDALVTQIRLDRQLLDAPLQFANPAMRKLYQQQCDALLTVSGGESGFVDEVRRFLLATPGRFPGIDAAAEFLHLSARTLRRRLENEGWTYQHLVHELRRQLAETYLQESVLSINEIAQLLGYSDTSNFRRAFINWTGRSPAACRRAALRTAVETSPAAPR